MPRLSFYLPQPALSRRLARFFVCTIVFATTAAADTENSLHTSPVPPLVAGAASDSFPKSYIGNTGKCEGFSVDLLDAVARVMDFKIERVVAPTAELHTRFQSGEFDLLQTYSPGPGRELFADFSVQFMNLQGAIFVRKNDSRFKTVEDLSQADLIIVGRGSIAEKFFSDHQIKARHVTYISSVQEALRLIEQGKHDAVFASRLTALSLIERDHHKNLTTMGEPFDGYDVQHCYAVHKGDARLLARLNEGLAILHRTGEFDEIYRKWYGRFDSPLFTREQVFTYLAAVLALASLAALWGLLRQRALRRRLAAQATQLLQQEAILAEAQQIAHVGHWSFALAARSIDFSTEALRILDRDPAQGPLTYLRLLTRIPASERSSAHRSIREAMLLGASCEITLTLSTPSGQRKIVHATVRAERDPDGRVARLFGTIQDITRLITAEERLRARDQLLLALYENAPNAMGVVEAAGDSFRFVSANPGTARLLGLNSNHLAGRLLDELGLPAAVTAFWTDLFRDANQRADNIRLERALPSLHRHYAVTLIPLGGAGAEARPQVCYLAEDITQRKQIDSEVAQGRKLRAIGELVGGIAHEFNNLLTPVLLKTELIADELRGNSRLLTELRAITHAAQRGADLTRRLLAFGRRSDSGEEIVHLPALLKSNLDLVRTTIDRRIELVTDVPNSLTPLYLNATDLHQIVLNLLLNARDTLVEKLERAPSNVWHPRISIQASGLQNAPGEPDSNADRRILGWVSLTVQDNGLGMTREVQERIFEPFYTTKGVGKGTGLGLATVWHLVTRIGGKVNVTSSPGEGSTFQVLLPVFSPPSAVSTSLPPTSAKEVTSRRILLVEDDALVAQTLATALRRLRHEVTHIGHGTEAWRHLSANPDYDLVMLDIDLPGLNGVEIARRLRGTRFKGKILIASGRLAEHELRELRGLMIDHVLEKPFTPQALQLALQACLQTV
ncbi:MAG: transporter substrate-binding domain-containing protein [Nibricoccus sp.]